MKYGRPIVYCTLRTQVDKIDIDSLTLKLREFPSCNRKKNLMKNPLSVRKNSSPIKGEDELLELSSVSSSKIVFSTHEPVSQCFPNCNRTLDLHKLTVHFLL